MGEGKRGEWERWRDGKGGGLERKVWGGKGEGGFLLGKKIYLLGNECVGVGGVRDGEIWDVDGVGCENGVVFGDWGIEEGGLGRIVDDGEKVVLGDVGVLGRMEEVVVCERDIRGLERVDVIEEIVVYGIRGRGVLVCEVGDVDVREGVGLGGVVVKGFCGNCWDNYRF